MALYRLSSRSLSSAMVMLRVSSVVLFCRCWSAPTSPLTSARTECVVSSFCCRSPRSILSAWSPTCVSSSDLPLSIFDINVVSVLLNESDLLLLLPTVCFSSMHTYRLAVGSWRYRQLPTENRRSSVGVYQTPTRSSALIGAIPPIQNLNRR